ncbi:hypothetical protein, partial [Inquilinus sp. OTU3971]|uniref:hypothetical protein n=1 Tax=Inquilinus sp. OTU3971 TaxID=3043855 RepID=UPI00313DF80B
RPLGVLRPIDSHQNSRDHHSLPSWWELQLSHLVGHCALRWIKQIASRALPEGSREACCFRS